MIDFLKRIFSSNSQTKEKAASFYKGVVFYTKLRNDYTSKFEKAQSLKDQISSNQAASRLNEVLEHLFNKIESTNEMLAEYVYNFNQVIKKGCDSVLEFKKYSTLGLDRNNLPQINDKANLSNVIEELQKKGIGVKNLTMKVKDLMPLQKFEDFDETKIFEMIQNASSLPVDDYLVGSDNRLLDRQHRWAAQLQINPELEVNVMQFDKPIENLLPEINNILKKETLLKGLVATFQKVPLISLVQFLLQKDLSQEVKQLAVNSYLQRMVQNIGNEKD